MQTEPQSVGGNVKLTSLTDSTVNYNAYRNGFINLHSAEPSLGLPSGSTYVNLNSAYYFPVFAIDSNYGNSRKFTGNDTLVFKNKNLGFNNSNPQYSFDLNGSLNVVSGANITVLSASYIVPASGSNSLYFNYPNGVYFNSNVYLNNNTYVSNITANELITSYISAASSVFSNKIVTVFTLSSANLTGLNISGNLTAKNLTVLSSFYALNLTAKNINVNLLSAQNITLFNNLSVGGDIYANKIHGLIDLDPNSILAFNSSNQLTVNGNTYYRYSIRPSDSHSTDNSTTLRSYGGLCDGNNYGTMAPFFKTFGGVLNYVTTNKIQGFHLEIYIDEDIIEGELYPNAYPNDNSGTYSNLNITGNMKSLFYSTEWLGHNYPALTAAGIMGGDFVWPLDETRYLEGQCGYWGFDPSFNFQHIYIQPRYDYSKLIGGGVNYQWYKPYDQPPIKLIHRTYMCNTTGLSAGQFGPLDQTSIYNNWLALNTKTGHYARPIGFNCNCLDINIQRLCFEFNSNANDSTALMFYAGQVNTNNITVALLGNAVYAYGAVCSYINPSRVSMGYDYQFDPYYYQSAYNYSLRTNNNVLPGGDPLYFPGYSLAIVGNPNGVAPTNLTNGFVRIINGGYFNQWDYGSTSRNYGYRSMIQSYPIFDYNFNCNSYFNIENGSIARDINHYVILGKNFGLSSYEVDYNNNLAYLTDSALNFKHLNFVGSFNSCIYPGDYNNDSGASVMNKWTFGTTDPSRITSLPKYFFYEYNGQFNDDSSEPCIFNPAISSVDCGPVIYGNIATNSISYFSNSMQQESGTVQIYQDRTGQATIDDLYKLKTPQTIETLNDNNGFYTLNFYASSKR